jgi:hypothetical protein
MFFDICSTVLLKTKFPSSFAEIHSPWMVVCAPLGRTYNSQIDRSHFNSQSNKLDFIDGHQRTRTIRQITNRISILRRTSHPSVNQRGQRARLVDLALCPKGGKKKRPQSWVRLLCRYFHSVCGTRHTQ